MRFKSGWYLFGLGALAACSHATSSSGGMTPAPSNNSMAMGFPASPRPDPRVGLKPGMFDAGEAIWNLRVLSKTPSPPPFKGSTNSDLAFWSHYAIQGNYNGYMVWDLANPTAPTLAASFYCPASQNDVSVYHNLLVMSSEATASRLDCQSGGVQGPVNKDRMRGVRIFDISDIKNPKLVASVQTCRGSHTHTLVVDPKDRDNFYVYISGSAGVRPSDELAGCSNALPENDPNSAHFRIEVIKVPVAHPEQAAIVSSPRIFNDLAAVKSHGPGTDDLADLQKAKARGAYTAMIGSDEILLPDGFVKTMLDSVVKARSGTGPATRADSAALRTALPGIIAKLIGAGNNGPPRGPDQCHDITVYPAVGLAGGACGGYGLLLDMSDPAHPVRIGAAADTNFSYWHSATFNNDGTKLLFSDEWGGGGGPKCRATDRPEWGGDAIFTIENRKMVFKSYYKMLAPQTKFENCVAHNGSLIPIPGRDVMVQAWYQGGISVFDWTDASHPREIAFFDRGPVDTTAGGGAGGGSWSVYWYNGVIVSSEIARGLDIFELTPNPAITQNEIDAAKTVHFDYYNTQGQLKFTWPATFALARAYLDQLDRSKGLSGGKIGSARAALAKAQGESGSARSETLGKLNKELSGEASGADRDKIVKLAAVVGDPAIR